MKKISVLILICLAFSQLKAQDGSIVFKIKYLPGHLYESNITMEMNMEMNISGDQKTMDKIKAKGIKLPMIMTSLSTIGVNIETGVVKNEDNFPVVISYKGVTSKKTINGEETANAPNPLMGQKIYGTCNASGKMRLDSISGKTLDESLKTTLTTSISNLASMIKFPEKPLNIGDTFTQDVPFNLPVSGFNMQSTIKVTYKLTSIENNSAYFDLDQSMVFDMSAKKDSVLITMKGTGKGDGKLIYNIDKNFASSNKSNFSFDFQLFAENMTMNGKATMSSTHETIISSTAK